MDIIKFILKLLIKLIIFPYKLVVALIKIVSLKELDDLKKKDEKEDLKYEREKLPKRNRNSSKSQEVSIRMDKY